MLERGESGLSVALPLFGRVEWTFSGNLSESDSEEWFDILVGERLGGSTCVLAVEKVFF